MRERHTSVAQRTRMIPTRIHCFCSQCCHRWSSDDQLILVSSPNVVLAVQQSQSRATDLDNSELNCTMMELFSSLKHDQKLSDKDAKANTLHLCCYIYPVSYIFSVLYGVSSCSIPREPNSMTRLRFLLHNRKERRDCSPQVCAVLMPCWRSDEHHQLRQCITSSIITAPPNRCTPYLCQCILCQCCTNSGKT